MTEKIHPATGVRFETKGDRERKRKGKDLLTNLDWLIWTSGMLKPKDPVVVRDTYPPIGALSQ